MGQKYQIGDKIINNQGFEVTIIERFPVKHKELLVEFNDEDHTQIRCGSQSFKNKTVKNPKYKRGIDKRIINNQKNRIGTIGTNNLGETLKVIKYRSSTDIDVEFQDEYRGIVTTTWDQFQKGYVKNPNQRKTGIIKHSSNFVDLTGQTFNDLLVLGWDSNPPDTERIKGNATGLWKCKCLRCDNSAWANTDELKNGSRKACRVCGNEAKATRKYSIKYDLSGKYGIGYTYNTNHPFYFDLEDYDLIKDYSWKENSDGYIVAVRNNKDILMHRLIMRVDNPDDTVDHIKHERFDNRKSMLRITTRKNNLRNKSLSKNNKSGKTGVYWDKDRQKWRAYIWVGKNIHLGAYTSLEAAIDARLKAEKKYFGDYSYDRSMTIGDINERKYI